MLDEQAESIGSVLAALGQWMAPAASAPILQSTLASRVAARTFLNNCQALDVRQPRLSQAVRAAPAPVLNWTYGRDGALTARDAEGAWWGGSSLPLQVGRSLLKTMQPAGRVICLLAPATAGQIRAAMENIDPTQAMIVIQPALHELHVALHCEDFSAEIAPGRLWFVAGENWSGDLARLLADHPGVCVPQQYIRTALLDEPTMAALTGAGNRVFADETARRSMIIEQIRQCRPSRPQTGRLCVIGGSRFSLWDLAPAIFAKTFAEARVNWEIINIEEARTASPLHLAQTADQCDAVIAPDLCRADLPGVVPTQIPWITWVTRPHIAPPDAVSPDDGLLLADETWRSAALRAGWAHDRVGVAHWPTLDDAEQPPGPGNGSLALIADATLDSSPKALLDFSSHLVLWEQIAHELMARPLELNDDPLAFLSARMKRLNIAPDTLDTNKFIHQLILPAWRLGVARLLASAGLPVVLFGKGWDAYPEFSRHWGGEVTSLGELRQIRRAVSVVICPIPSRAAHAVSMLGRPVLHATRQRESFVREARLALGRPCVLRPITAPLLSAGKVLSVVPGLSLDAVSIAGTSRSCAD